MLWKLYMSYTMYSEIIDCNDCNIDKLVDKF